MAKKRKFAIQQANLKAFKVPKSQRIPTLADMKKGIPTGGLMNSGLRKITTRSKSRSLKISKGFL